MMMKNLTKILSYRRAALPIMAVLVFSCSLGLDASLIDKVKSEPSGSLDASTDFDSSVEDVEDSGLPRPADAGACTKDEDCTGAGCFTPRCDVSRHACVMEVCRPSACNSSSCNVAEKQCGTPKPYKFGAAQFPVGATIGCGGSLQACFAAVYPFVFVGTVDGVVAFSAVDPQSTKPSVVPVAGLGFIPTRILASGSRVYFLGPPFAVPAGARLPVAYADVPSDPFVAQIPTTTSLATHPRSPSEPLNLFPRIGDTALLVDLAPASSYASSPIEPPFVEPFALAAQPITVPSGATPVAVSGSRLVLGQASSGTISSFMFVNDAGSKNPVTTAEVTIGTASPVGGQHAFAQSSDGALFWAYASIPPAPPTVPATSAAKGFFLLAGESGPFDPATGIVLETYTSLARTTPIVGPTAMLDAKTAIVTTAVVSTPTQTNVRFVTREPLEVVKNGDGSPRTFALSASVEEIAVAGSNGLGYVLAVDPPSGPTIYVFDRACAP